MVNLDNDTVVDLIDSRDTDTVSSWLKEFPKLTVVSRAGAMFFKDAITAADPDITQISDRFHYLKTATNHCFRGILHSLPLSFPSDVDVDPAMTHPVHRSPDSDKQWAEKKELVAKVRQDYHQGMHIVDIATKWCLGRRTVRNYVQHTQHRRTRKVLNALVKYTSVVKKWSAKNYSKKEIYAKVQKAGYSRAYSTFCAYLPFVLNLPDETESIARKQVADLVYQHSDRCNNVPLLVKLFKYYPVVKEILTYLFDLYDLTEGRSSESLDRWLKRAASLHNKSLDAAVASIKRDKEAIQNSIQYQQYSNGVVEGKNTKIKLIKRIMFGRCSFSTLKTKVLLSEN